MPDPTVAELSAAIDILSRRVTEVEEENVRLKISMEPLAAAAVSTSADCANGGSALLQRMTWDDCLANPQPLDASATWARRQPSDDAGAGYVRTVLALLSEGHGVNSYPWPLFVQVRATPDASATISSANAFAVNGRLVNLGSGFGAAFFSDVQHAGGGTDVGYDLELIRSTPHGHTIGVNILNAGDPSNSVKTAHSGDEAINIQTQVADKGWLTAIRLEPNAVSGKAGVRGVWMQGQYDIGLDMENNNIKLNRGAKIFFDENQTLYLWLNPTNTRLEFKYLDQVLGFLTLATEEHEL